MLVVLSGVPSTNPAHAQNSPSVAVDLSSASVEEGTAIAVTMSFGSLTFDDDRATKDYIFRADVVGADQCEEQAGGYGLGVDRYMYQVDEDPEVRRGTISADCPAGDYTIRARVSDANGGELASASASFSVAAPEPEPTPDPDSNDGPGSNQQDPDPPAPPIVLLAIPSEFTGGEEAQISMGFSGLEFDSDRSTIDYIFRADVKDSENADADECEVEAGGYGLGVDRYMYQVDEDPETRSGTISADCPAGDYTLRASISSSGNQELASASAPFSVAASTADEVDDPDTDLASVSSRDITLHSSNGNATGVWSDGTTVWVSDQGDDKLYAYTLADGTRDTSKEFSTHSDNATPSGIWSNGTTIWVADSVDYKFYAYTLAGGARASGKDFDMAGAPANALPLGIWSNGATMWMADNRDDKLYAYTLSGGARDTGKEFSLHSDNGKPRGIWSDASTIWVADADDDKVYAYTRPNGARDAGKDFDLGAANGDPKGIWSNGMIMWVIDEDDNKLYAYDLPVSADATLSALTVSPRDVIGFASDTTTYHVGVANSVTQATITATTNDANATIAIGGTAVTSGAGHQVSLSEGLNTVTITVTAEDGSTEQVYTIYVGRGVTADFGWKASDDFNGLTAAGNDNPLGIWSNGATTWVLDSTDRKIYAYTAATKARDTTKDFNTLDTLNVGSREIWSDGSTMWVSDGLIAKVFAYDLATKARDSGRDFNTLASAGNITPQGIWSDGTTVWVVNGTVDEDKIYAYNLATKQRDSGKDFDTLTAAENTDPRGIWSDGDTMWVADRSDDKIYAYNLATKERDASKDFNTLADAGNTGARGIWSDGETMWVSDSDSDKIYSYNMPPPPPVGNQQDAPCGDQQAVFVLNSDRHRQPRITSAVYDATLDAVVLEWSAGSDIAGLTGFKIRRIAEGGMTEETYADLCDDPEGTDSRPSVGETVRSYADVGVPATWQIIYNVYAIYGSKEVPSWSVAAKMTAAHGLVRARISSDASQTFLDIGWMDKGSLADGYKVYVKLAIQSGTFWSDIAPSDTDPAPQRYANTSSTVFPVGNSYTIRIRHGGTDEDTGTLIGEVTTTVVAAE